ncbi:TonB-dependent siderophore receptor [Sessilibacter sp. MAH4]
MNIKKSQRCGLCVAILSVNSISFAQSNTQIEEVSVTGHKREYQTEEVSGSIGFNVSPLDVPISIDVINQDILKDQQVNNVDDALRNVSGVTKFKTGNGGEEQFAIHGFSASQSIYKDGARINNAQNSTNIPSTETANIEKVEVLKGPSAILYGQGEPGGTINYVTKKPEFESFHEVELLTGSDSFSKIEFDSTGAIGNSDQFAYRIVGSYEDSDSFRDFVERERFLLNPSISYLNNTGGILTASVEYIDDDFTTDRSQILSGDFINGFDYDSSVLDTEQFYGIAGFNNRSNAESTRVSLTYNQPINDFYSIDLLASYTKNEKTNFDSTPLFATPATIGLLAQIGFPAPVNLGQVLLPDGTVLIQPRFGEGEGETTYLQANNLFEFSSGSLAHKLLLGISYEELETNSFTTTGLNIATYNIFSNQRSFVPLAAGIPTDEVFLNPVGTDIKIKSEEISLNVQDLIEINEQFTVLLGGRFVDYESNANLGGDEAFDDTDFTGRLGVIYKPAENISLYASYAQGYLPATGSLDVNGNQIDSETNSQFEIGLKANVLNERLLFTVALYDAERKDVASFDAAATQQSNFNVFDTIGRVESRGLDVQIIGKITDAWRIVAGYAYIDSEIDTVTTSIFGGVLDLDGREQAGIPENSANLWSVYEFTNGFGIGGGLFYQDDTFASAENNTEFDGFTQVDAVAYYKHNLWKFQFNAINLTDEEYQLAQGGVAEDLFASVRVGTSVPRSFVFSVSKEF